MTLQKNELICCLRCVVHETTKVCVDHDASIKICPIFLAD